MTIEPSPLNQSESVERTSPTLSLPANSSMSHGKVKDKGKKKDRLPKLTLHCIKDTEIAECLFDTHKNARITFQFGLQEDAPEDIADKMVGAFIV